MDDALRGVLVGMAANPAAPTDVLSRLVALPSAADKMAWRQSNLPDTVVERLLATGESVIAFALDSPKQPEATRRRIAEHPDAEIREARKEYVEHHVRIGLQVAPDELARYAGPGGLVGLAQQEDPLVRVAVAATWEAMPVAVRRDLLIDPDPRVRKAAAGYPHPPAPADLHAELLRDEATRDEVVSYAVLTSEAVRDCLAGDEKLRAAVAVNPSLPPQARDLLAEDPSPYVRARVVLRQDLNEDRRRRMHAALHAEFEAGSYHAAMALGRLDQDYPTWLEELPLVELVAHLDSPIRCFRRCAAMSDALPEEVVRRLHTHDDVLVRRIVAYRPDAPGEALERLFVEHGEHYPHHTEHPNFPPEAYIRLATAEDPRHRSAALHGPDLPVDLVTLLAHDTEAFVRAAAARHRRIPMAVLEVLVTDSAPQVTEAAGANPVLSVDTMRGLLDRAGL